MRGGNRALGNFGENTAARFLSRKGYRIIGKNVRTFVGEIDIVAQLKSCLVFAEIKTRQSKTLGPPYISITEKKKRKLIQCARCYMKMKHLTGVDWQIDVISVEIDKLDRQIIIIEHFENAIEERQV